MLYYEIKSKDIIRDFVNSKNGRELTVVVQCLLIQNVLEIMAMVEMVVEAEMDNL